MKVPNSDRIITVKIRRGDLVTTLLALNVVIQATNKDHIPNEQVIKARNVLGSALSDFDITSMRKEAPVHGKDSECKETGKADFKAETGS